MIVTNAKDLLIDIVFSKKTYFQNVEKETRENAFAKILVFTNTDFIKCVFNPIHKLK